MKNVFIVTKYAGQLAQLSGDLIVTGAGYLTEKVSDIALFHIDQREKK